MTLHGKQGLCRAIWPSQVIPLDRQAFNRENRTDEGVGVIGAIPFRQV